MDMDDVLLLFVFIILLFLSFVVGFSVHRYRFDNKNVETILVSENHVKSNANEEKVTLFS